MRARSLTTLAAAVAFSVALPLAAAGPAFSAAWRVVNQRIVQIQYACRDGVVLDFAVDNLDDQFNNIPVEARDSAGTVILKNTQVYVPRTPQTGVNAMEPLSPDIKRMARGYKLSWKASQAPGTKVQVRIENSDIPVTVESCSIADGLEPLKIGYVWSHDPKPTESPYTPHPYWSYNSRLKTVVKEIVEGKDKQKIQRYRVEPNTIAWEGTGKYTVKFPGLGTSGGNAQVTAFGETNVHCKIGGLHWRKVDDKDLLLDVRCFNSVGKPVDARFTASFTAGGGNGTIAYAWVDKKESGSEDLDPKRQHNSRGGKISVDRLGTGYYKVKIPDSSGRRAGSVKVTAQGDSPTACKVAGWEPNTAAQQVWVRCFGEREREESGKKWIEQGVPTDSKFTIAYVDEINLLGSRRMSTAYVRAEQPSNEHTYTPWPSHQFNSKNADKADNTVTRVATGSYDVFLPSLRTAVKGDTSSSDSLDGGNVQVSAYGVHAAQSRDTVRCGVGYWKNEDLGRLIRVHCYERVFTDRNGDGDTRDHGEAADQPADSMFTMQYTAQMQ